MPPIPTPPLLQDTRACAHIHTHNGADAAIYTFHTTLERQSLVTPHLAGVDAFLHSLVQCASVCLCVCVCVSIQAAGLSQRDMLEH